MDGVKSKNLSPGAPSRSLALPHLAGRIFPDRLARAHPPLLAVAERLVEAHRVAVEHLDLVSLPVASSLLGLRHGLRN
jgi:hypothetical protein